MRNIIHILSRTDWENAKQMGSYHATSLKKEGFIHCSLPHQIPAVANYNFKGRTDLVLIEIDVDRLESEVKFEDLYNLSEDFPHVYGPINLNSVIRVISFPSESDGTFKLPVELF